MLDSMAKSGDNDKVPAVAKESDESKTILR
jgi:hypothetical protein